MVGCKKDKNDASLCFRISGLIYWEQFDTNQHYYTDFSLATNVKRLERSVGIWAEDNNYKLQH